MTTWCEVVVPCTEHIEEFGALLIGRMPETSEGLIEHTDGVGFWVELNTSEEVLARLSAIVGEFDQARYGLGKAEIRGSLDESDWREAWKKYFKVERLTSQVVVVPSWEQYVEVEGDLVIHLDPGQAFGTGAHATTRLLLAALQKLHDDEVSIANFADIGCGSAILSIAAKKMWPESQGMAIDIDPVAITAAVENAKRNQCDIVIGEGIPADVTETYQLVLANIQAPVHLKNIDHFKRMTAANGHLFLSGILGHQVAAVVAAFEKSGGFAVVGTESDMDKDEWVSIHLRANED